MTIDEKEKFLIDFMKESCGIYKKFPLNFEKQLNEVKFSKNSKFIHGYINHLSKIYILFYMITLTYYDSVNFKKKEKYIITFEHFVPARIVTMRDYDIGYNCCFIPIERVFEVYNMSIIDKLKVMEIIKKNF